MAPLRPGAARRIRRGLPAWAAGLLSVGTILLSAPVGEWPSHLLTAVQERGRLKHVRSGASASVPAPKLGLRGRQGLRGLGDPLVPDRVLDVPGGPVLVLEAATGLPAAGIRMSAPLDPYQPAAATALVSLALTRARPIAELVGASLWGGVEHGRIAYHVIGDLRDMDELAWIVRILASSPSREGMWEALARQRAHADRMAETPHGRALAEIDARAAESGEGSGVGTAPVESLAEVENLWKATHARDRLRIFVLGDVSLPVILSDFSFVGAPTEAQGGASARGSGPTAGDGVSDTTVALSRSRGPVAGRAPPSPAWAGAFFSLGTPGDPAALVARNALAAGLRSLQPQGVVVRVQHDLGERARWTAVTTTALAQRAADSALEEALSLMSATSLAARWAAAAERARRALLAATSTPEGWLRIADRYYSHAGFARGAAEALEAAGKPELDAVAATFESSLVRLGRGR